MLTPESITDLGLHLDAWKVSYCLLMKGVFDMLLQVIGDGKSMAELGVFQSVGFPCRRQLCGSC